VGRGGGSIEDLWAFNEEAVARAIRGSAIPVISAVGHETDFTIADFAADLRAPTPSAAAELVAAHEEQLCTTLEQLVGGLRRLVNYRIAAERARVQELTFARGFEEVRARLRHAMNSVSTREDRLRDTIGRVYQTAFRRFDAAARLLSPAELRSRTTRQRARFETLNQARMAAIMSRMESARSQFGVAAVALDAMSPLRTLERGYAIAQDAGGTIVREAAAVSPGDELRVRLWKGAVDCRVEKTELKNGA
jgi:exodeoxyribonuclease VII large subunit